MYPSDLVTLEELSDQPDVMCRGGSVIVSPLGEVMAGPLYDEEGILSADLDLSETTRAKVDFDVVGHYARPDIFRLYVNSEPQSPVVGESGKNA
jgi:nitrilase